MVHLPKSLLPCRLGIEAKVDICPIYVASCFMTYLKYPATHFLLLFLWLVKAPMTWKALFPYQTSLSLFVFFCFCATRLSHANVCNQNLDNLTSIAVWILHRSYLPSCNQRRTYFDLHQKWIEDQITLIHESIITSSWLPFNVSLCL